jgi:1-acyl-sn-glycerol-3-phosphate acyltransferase
MLSKLKSSFIEQTTRPDLLEKVDRAVLHVNSAGFDDWGLHPGTLKAAVGVLEAIYTKYFRVKTVGIENIPSGRVLLVANHGGQLPLDGMLISLAVLLDGKPPRIARGMVERWFPSLPFVSTFFTRCGGMVGDHRNCRLLLERDECVLVFPEGVRGSGKTIHDAYKLEKFGTGFLRLALEAKAPIVPVAVIGCEETYPGIYNFKSLAKLVGAPYLPVTPFFPLLGPLGLVPLPTQVTLRFGQPLRFDLDPEAPDAEVAELVDQVRDSLREQIHIGLEERGGKIFG